MVVVCWLSDHPNFTWANYYYREKSLVELKVENNSLNLSILKFENESSIYAWLCKYSDKKR